jgi:hypothetical protein
MADENANPAPPVDYAALAKKHGGALAPNSPALKAPTLKKIDYAALAKKHGGAPAAQPAQPTPTNDLSKIEENPSQEGTYAVKVNGQVKQVPFSKVPHVAAIAPSGAYGHTTFANTEDEKRFYKDLYALPDDRKSSMYQASNEQWKAPVGENPEEQSKPEPVHEPTWWRRTKKGSSAMYDLFLGGSGPGGMPNIPPAIIGGTDLDPQVMLQKQAAKGDAQAQQTLGLQQEIAKTFETPLANVSGSAAFQKVFDPNSKSKFSRGVTGFTKSVEGMTSIDNIYSLAAIYMAPESISKPMGLVFQADIAKSGVEGIAGASEAAAKGDAGASSEAWGGMLGNIAVIAAMGTGERAIRSGVDAFQNSDTTAILNDKAQEAYEKKFGDLTPNEKASVLYEAVEDANPKFKKRVDQEVAKLNQKRVAPRFFHGEGKDAEGRPLIKKVGIDPRAAKAGAEAAELTTEEVRQQRLEAAKKLTRQIVERKARAEAYKQEAAKREHTARQAADAQEQSRQADTIPSAEEQRGFGVEESRTAENLPVTGLRKTTERESGQRYDPEHPEPTIPVVDRRAAGEPTPEEHAQITAAERAVQERTEAQFGQSFTSLPVDRQKLAAAWLEKTHPEQWEAFKKTPAYERHLSDVKHADLADAAVKQYLARNATGDQQPLAPGADIAAGTAKLILARSNIDSVLKADPETSRDLNAHTERFIGKSFDALPAEMRAPALADYLRTKPEKVHSFMTVDLTERMRTGQHIDIANMDAAGLMRQRASLRMDQRDSIRRSMDEDLAVQMVTEERDSHHSELAAAITASDTGRSPSLDEVSRVSKGLSEQASKMGLGEVHSPADLFRIEKDVKALPERTRTPAVNEFLVRMRQVRAAAQAHIATELAERTAASFRENAEEARPAAIEQVARLSIQSSELQQAADDLRMQGQAAAADAARQTADFVRQKAEAVVAGAESVQNPAPPPPPGRPRPKIVLGGVTEIVTPNHPEGLKAHYVLLPSKAVRTSHHPVTFEPTEGYDQKVQKRHYDTDKSAQADVTVNGANPDGRILYSDTPLTMDGPPVVAWRPDADGSATVLEVVGGNGREMIRQRARLLHSDAHEKLMNFRSTRIDRFGLSDAAGNVEFGGEPYDVYRLLDEPVTSEIEWTRLGEDSNRDPMKGSSAEEEGVAMSRLLTPEYLDRLDNIFSSLPHIETDKQGREHPISLRTAMRTRSSDIVQLLVDAGIIAPNKRTEYIVQNGESKGDLTPKTKDLIENMLIGLTVTDPQVLTDAPADVKNKLARAGVFFVKAKSAGENWNLASYNTDAVRLYTKADAMSYRLSRLRGTSEATSKGAGSSSLIEKYLYTGNYEDKNGLNAEQGDLSLNSFSFADGQSLGHPETDAVTAMAMALEQTPREYALMLAKYADRTKPSMFGAEHPADVFNAEIAGKFKNGEGNPLHVIPEEWGAVAPMPEAVKAAIEDARGPLPIEPEVHAETVVADVQPDSSSVVGNLKDTPRTVADLRSALETHPGMTPEQAEAVTQMFEEILPRAIGESMESILGNRRLSFSIGGETKDSFGKYRGYTEMVDEGHTVIRLCDSADTSTFIHEMAHHIRRYLRPDDQRVANEFVGAKPGEEWTEAQEEQFAQAFERYHYDGGIRRGKLEKVFATISRAMQLIYNSVTSRKLAQGSKELNAMFDKWYDWTRAERKPITERLDVDALAEAANGKVEIPVKAKMIERGGRRLSDNAQNFVFVNKESFYDFLRNRKNQVKGWELHQVKGEETTYARADSKAKKLYQPGLGETMELAKKAKALEDELKRETDPRRQALLRGQLNGVEDKLRGSTLVIGGKAEPKDTSAIQLVHGVSEMPRLDEPTTPAQAVTVQQTHGDPTAISLGGERGKPGRVPDGSAGVREEKPVGRVPEQRGAADGEHGAGEGKGTPIAKPAKNPLHDVKAAKLKAPEKQRGTPVVDPEVWRGHVEALGWPEGTPPPTYRISPDMREVLSLYPGQSESAEGVISALQQHDGTVLAAPLGSGKTVLNSVIANELLGTSGDKVGFIVTRSANLIEEADGYLEWGHHIGLTIEKLPSDMSEIQAGGVYAGTYAQIRGNKAAFSIPWDFVIFDESAEARNWTESDQGRAVVMLSHAAKKVVYSSATPYSTIMEMGYMHKLGLWPKGGFAEWAGQFGLREIAPNTYSGGTSAKKLTKLRQQLIERGQWQTLYKDMDGVEGHVALVPQTEEVRAGVRAIRSAFAKAAKAFQKAGMSRYLTPTLGHEAIYLKRYIAGSKLMGAIDLAQKLVKEGWAPILFTEYRSPAEDGMEFFHNLPGDMGTEINKMLPPLPDVVGKMREAFGDKIGIFAGDANQIRAGELEAFQSGEKDAIYMTYGAGAVGANAQDKVGDRPRAAVFVDLPWGGMMFEQGTGRPWRYGSKSNVAMFFLTSDALPEMKLLSTKILPRMRSLKAAVYGEKVESQLAKNLREAVGIPEELLEYEEGQEVKPQASEWEQDGEGATYTHLADLEIPSAAKAKNKGMKYKGAGKKLYQGPKDGDLDPWERAAQDAWQELLGRTRELPAPEARAVTANEKIIKTEAAEAGQRAMGSGEPVKDAVERKTRDMAIDIQLSDKALIALHEGKGSVRNLAHWAQETGWMLATSGDKVVEKAFKRAGMAKDGEEMKRRMIDTDIRKGLYQGRMQAVIRDIVHGNGLKPPDIELMSKVVEGQATSDDPRINKAAKEFRAFTSSVRKALADADCSVVIYENGIRKEIPYSAIEDDPRYWPRMYDWNKKFIVTDKVTGKKEVTSLSDIMNMPTSDARRERVIEQFAEERGISKLQARAFFERNDRGIRLAGNIERAREWNIPTYGRDRQAIERYIDQVATTLAVTEVHGQFRQKTDPIISQLPTYEAGLVDRILTSDLDPAHLPPSDRTMLSASSAVIITGKMLYSPIKVLSHLWKASLATNTRSLVAGLMDGAIHPAELRERARDCNALLDYSKSAWMREYGMKRGNIGQKFLDFNGFSLEIQVSRVMGSAMGRHYFERYAYPELVKDPQNPVLRRKLKDLYGMSDEHLDGIIKNGYGADDVRRMELGAANWVTGSNRPSEMPPAFRARKNADAMDHRFVTTLRMTQMLHGFMFKTANLVNRTVFEELYKSNWKSVEPYHLIGKFAFNAGLAGFALEQLLFARHKLQHSAEAEIEKNRHEWLAAHPASAEALWWAMANMSMAIGVQPLSDLFNTLATTNPKDRNKLAQQHRFTRGVMGMPLGIPGQDAEAILTAFEDMTNSFSDTGKHKLSAEVRRNNIVKRLLGQEVVGSNLIPGAAPVKVIPTHSGHRHKSGGRM